MLFVTLHGGKPERNPHKNNVHAYDKDGKKITASVLEDTDDVMLDELRAIHLVGKYLYVVNANNTQNSVLCYAGSDAKYRFVGRFISHEICEGILHPFDLTFDDGGHCYLSSQDTNVVTRLKVSDEGKIGVPATLAPALPARGAFLPGTFVASAVGGLGGATTPVPPPAGLTYTADGQKKHSVRGVLWANDSLYVADQPAGRVKVYDNTGRFQGQSNAVESPVHLLAHNGSLYVSGGNDVLTGKLPKRGGDFTLSAIKGVHVEHASGMAFSDAGHFYVASRTENVVLELDSDFKPRKFCDLPDNPEFLLHV